MPEPSTWTESFVNFLKPKASPGDMAIDTAVAQDANKQVIQNVLASALAAAGAGAGVRGLQGLGELVGRATRKPVPSLSAPALVPVPTQYPRRDEKRANVKTASPPAPKLPPASAPYSFRQLTDVNPMYPTALGIGMIGGGLGGYKLIDWLLNKRRKEELDSELQAAKQEYTNVLMNKNSEYDRLHNALDALYERLEKSAEPDAVSSANEFMGFPFGQEALSAYLALATAAGGLGFLGGHSYGKARSERAKVETAQKERLRSMSERMPPPLLAYHDPQGADLVESEPPRKAAPSLFPTH